MFNPERLLGRMVKKGIRNEVGKVGGAAIGLGLFGVAIAAVEHFTSGRGQNTPSASPPPPPATASTPPPLPPAFSGGQAAALPPPLPEQATTAQKRSIVLVRGMVAAAAADGEIDATERRSILGQLAAAGADEQERAFLENELENPPSLQELLPLVEDAEMAEQFYAACLLAIRVDTDAEREFLQQVASQLKLADETLNRLHRDLGID